MTGKRGKRQGLRARSKNARQGMKSVKSVDWLRKRKALNDRKAKAKKSAAGKRAKRPRASVRENPKDRVAAPAFPPPIDESSSQSESADAEGGTPASTEHEAEFQQAGETNDPFEQTLPVPSEVQP